MSGLADRKCVPYKNGTAPLTAARAKTLSRKLHRDWRISADQQRLQRAYKFKDFYRTMSFVGALAHIANSEDHHPDLEVGYNYCRVSWTTHSLGGLSTNDFICAAKIDRL